tara:strand:- start:5673 stop:6182 length:510 start_codon:yes stop_codon:yes gene_type:complete
MQDTPTPAGRRLRWALIASLGLNLVFVGLFAGAAYRNAGGPGAGMRDGGPNARNYATPYVKALDRADRRAVFRAMRAGQTGDAAPSRAERRALFDQVLVALRADPFDPAAVADVLRRQGRVALALQTASEGAWVAQVSRMSPADRLAYADRVEEELRRRPRKGDKPGRD